MKIYRDNHKLQISQKKKEWYEKNKIYCLQHNKEYRIKNNDKIKVIDKEKYLKNRQKYIESFKKYRETHKNEIKIMKREWLIKNPEKKLAAGIRHKEKISKLLGINKNTYRWVINSWSKSVKKRDLEICLYCGSTENLHAHHILPQKDYPELSLILNNGITVCRDCHLDIHRGIING